MFVVPFFLRAPTPSLIQWQLVPITLFLENHGKQLCSVEEANEWLHENGFSTKRTWKEENILFAEIDVEKTSLKDFYSFEQLTRNPKKGIEECWRTFYRMKTTSDDFQSEKLWNDNVEDPFHKVLQAIYTKCS